LRPASALLVALSLFAASGCGRSHDLEEGSYIITVAPGGVFRDDCGLADGGGPSLAVQFQAFGDDVRMALVQQADAQCLAVELVGQYQFDNQDFFADGTASNPPLVANGQVCQVNFVQFHTDADTVGPASFSGVMRISYLASSPVACNCQFWFNYTAALCTASSCPAIPTECS
jgi:hypothetical protein